MVFHFNFHNFSTTLIVPVYKQDCLYFSQVYPPQPTDVKTVIATATEPGGQIDKFLIGADIRVAPMSLTLAKFLNEEADGALTSAQIVETTSNRFNISIFLFL